METTTTVPPSTEIAHVEATTPAFTGLSPETIKFLEELPDPYEDITAPKSEQPTATVSKPEPPKAFTPFPDIVPSPVSTPSQNLEAFRSPDPADPLAELSKAVNWREHTPEAKARQAEEAALHERIKNARTLYSPGVQAENPATTPPVAEAPQTTQKAPEAGQMTKTDRDAAFWKTLNEGNAARAASGVKLEDPANLEEARRRENPRYTAEVRAREEAPIKAANKLAEQARHQEEEDALSERVKNARTLTSDTSADKSSPSSEKTAEQSAFEEGIARMRAARERLRTAGIRGADAIREMNKVAAEVRGDDMSGGRVVDRTRVAGAAEAQRTTTQNILRNYEAREKAEAEQAKQQEQIDRQRAVRTQERETAQRDTAMRAKYQEVAARNRAAGNLESPANLDQPVESNTIPLRTNGQTEQQATAYFDAIHRKAVEMTTAVPTPVNPDQSVEPSAQEVPTEAAQPLTAEEQRQRLAESRTAHGLPPIEATQRPEKQTPTPPLHVEPPMPADFEEGVAAEKNRLANIPSTKDTADQAPKRGGLRGFFGRLFGRGKTTEPPVAEVATNNTDTSAEISSRDTIPISAKTEGTTYTNPPLTQEESAAVTAANYAAEQAAQFRAMGVEPPLAQAGESRQATEAVEAEKKGSLIRETLNGEATFHGEPHSALVEDPRTITTDTMRPSRAETPTLHPTYEITLDTDNGGLFGIVTSEGSADAPTDFGLNFVGHVRERLNKGDRGEVLLRSAIEDTNVDLLNTYSKRPPTEIAGVREVKETTEEAIIEPAAAIAFVENDQLIAATVGDARIATIDDRGNVQKIAANKDENVNVTTVPLSETLKGAIIAGDGVWNVLTDKEIAQVVSTASTFQEAATIIQKEALRRGTKGNVSVQVVNMSSVEG